jgi:hypothetical protein
MVNLRAQPSVVHSAWSSISINIDIELHGGIGGAFGAVFIVCGELARQPVVSDLGTYSAKFGILRPPSLPGVFLALFQGDAAFIPSDRPNTELIEPA